MCIQIQRSLLKREFANNETIKKNTIEVFSDRTRELLGHELLDSIAQVITMHLYNYLPVTVADAEVKNIMESINGQIVDATTEATSNALRVIERNNNHAASAFSQLFTEYDKLTKNCGCIECADEMEMANA